MSITQEAVLHPTPRKTLKFSIEAYTIYYYLLFAARRVYLLYFITSIRILSFNHANHQQPKTLYAEKSLRTLAGGPAGGMTVKPAFSAQAKLLNST